MSDRGFWPPIFVGGLRGKDRQLRREIGNTWRIVFIGCLALIISFLLTGKQILLADWGLIDDHQIFQLMGDSGKVYPWEIPKLLLDQTEFAQPVSPDYARYQPSFQLLRLLEISAWGDNVHLWYATQTVLFAFFIAAMWWIAANLVGVWLGFALILPALTAPFWGDVWGRLAATENYVSLGIALWALGVYGIFSRPPNHRTAAIILLTIGAIIAVGSKETVLALAGFTIAILGFLMFRRENVRISLACAVPVLLLASLVAVLITNRVALDSDPYGRPLGLERVQQAVTALGEVALRFWLPAVVAVAATVGLFFLLSGKKKEAINQITVPTGAFLIFSGCLGLFYVSQYVAYNASWPKTDMRYDFPGALTGQVLLGAFLAYAAIVFGKWNWHPWIRRGVVLAIICLVYIWGGPWRFPMLNTIDANIATTRAFSQIIEKAAEAARAEPLSPVILDSYGPWTWEPIDSVVRYLRHYGAQNEVALRYHPTPDPAGNGILVKVLQRWEAEGRPVLGLPPKPILVPLSSVGDRGAACISMGLNGPPSSGCAKGFKIY